MKRREFISGLIGAAAAWPLAAQAQKPDAPVVGFLSSVSRGPFAPMVSAFRNGLKQIGYAEGARLEVEIVAGEVTA